MGLFDSVSGLNACLSLWLRGRFEKFPTNQTIRRSIRDTPWGVILDARSLCIVVIDRLTRATGAWLLVDWWVCGVRERSVKTRIARAFCGYPSRFQLLHLSCCGRQCHMSTMGSKGDAIRIVPLGGARARCGCPAVLLQSLRHHDVRPHLQWQDLLWSRFRCIPTPTWPKGSHRDSIPDGSKTAIATSQTTQVKLCRIEMTANENGVKR